MYLQEEVGGDPPKYGTDETSLSPASLYEIRTYEQF